MTNPNLAAHPTPDSSMRDFKFSSFKELQAYTEFEKARTISEYKALGTALTKQERLEAKAALAKKRKAIYNLWKEQGQPSLGDAA